MYRVRPNSPKWPFWRVLEFDKLANFRRVLEFDKFAGEWPLLKYAPIRICLSIDFNLNVIFFRRSTIWKQNCTTSTRPSAIRLLKSQNWLKKTPDSSKKMSTSTVKVLVKVILIDDSDELTTHSLSSDDFQRLFVTHQGVKSRIFTIDNLCVSIRGLF